MIGQNSNTPNENFSIKAKSPRYITINEDIFLILSSEALKVYMFLRYEADYSQQTSDVGRNVKCIANKTKISIRKVNYCLNEIVNHGLIHIQKNPGYQNTYWVARELHHFSDKTKNKQNDENNDCPEPQGGLHMVQGGLHMVQGGLHMVQDIINNSSNNSFIKESITYSNTKESEFDSIVDNLSDPLLDQNLFPESEEGGVPNGHPNSKNKNIDKLKSKDLSSQHQKYRSEFLEFWECTNKKGSKWNAYKAWRSLKLDKRLDELKELWNIFYKNDFKNREHNFRPNISTWLNSHPWDNDKLPALPATENISKTQNKAYRNNLTTSAVPLYKSPVDRATGAKNDALGFGKLVSALKQGFKSENIDLINTELKEIYK